MATPVNWSERLAAHGATLLTEYREGRVAYVTFRCACGQEGRKTKANITSGQHPVCKDCSKQRMQQGSTPDAVFEQFFASKDATFIKVEQRGRATAVQGERPRLTLQLRCSCGEVFTSQWENVKKRNSNPLCQPCLRRRSSERRGELHPQYDPTLTAEDRAKIRCVGIDKWYADVIKAWGYTCAITGEGGKLSAHHLYNYKQYPGLRLLIPNGVAISPVLHLEFHSIYGRKHNTLAQFAEFFFAKTSRHFEPLPGLPDAVHI